MSKIKSIISGLVLFGLGGAVGYFTAKKILGEQYRYDVEDVQEFYYNKLKELGVMDSGFEPEILEEPEEDAEDDSEAREHFEKLTKTSVEKVERSKGRPIIHYNKPPIEQVLNNKQARVIEVDEDGEEDDDYNGIDPDEDEYEAELEARAEEYAKRRAENQSKGWPYVIDHSEYEHGPEEYEKQCLYYYSKDRVLCEDDDSIVDSEEDLVGLDYEDILDMQTTAWVRNDELGVMYEIHRIDDSYANAVQGVVETPRERDFRIKGRRKAAIDND